MQPTADVSVRTAWAADAEAIATVQVSAWRDSYASLLPADVLAELDPEPIAARWRASLDKPGDARNRVLVALERATVRGFAVTGASPDPDADPVADGEIAELVVEPTQRGAGHGSRLLQACADTMRADRFRRATTWLASTDDEATDVPHPRPAGHRTAPTASSTSAATRRSWSSRCGCTPISVTTRLSPRMSPAAAPSPVMPRSRKGRGTTRTRRSG